MSRSLKSYVRSFIDRQIVQMLNKAPEVNNEIWNRNFLLSHRMKEMNIRKIEFLSLKATYATTITCEKVSYITFWEI